MSTERGNYCSSIPNSSYLAERSAFGHFLHRNRLNVDVGGVAELEFQCIFYVVIGTFLSDEPDSWVELQSLWEPRSQKQKACPRNPWSNTCFVLQGNNEYYEESTTQFLVRKSTFGRTREVFVTIPSRHTIWFRRVVFRSRGLTTLLPKAPVNPMWKEAVRADCENLVFLLRACYLLIHLKWLTTLFTSFSSISTYWTGWRRILRIKIVKRMILRLCIVSEGTNIANIDDKPSIVSIEHFFHDILVRWTAILNQ